MEDLDFTSRPAKSAIYDPGVARGCFESQGKVEVIPQGGQFFAENQNSDKIGRPSSIKWYGRPSRSVAVKSSIPIA